MHYHLFVKHITNHLYNHWRHIVFCAVCVSLSIGIKGQDLPLFSQKITNAFINNPAVAGYGRGSVAISHRRDFSGVTGAPVNNFLSFHTPIKDHKIGLGLNIFQEQVNIFTNYYASGAFAYHIKLGRYRDLSMGVSAEVNNRKLSPEDINLTVINGQQVITDQVITQYQEGVTNVDFSFGSSFKNKYVTVAGTLNRLSSRFQLIDDNQLLSTFISGYVNAHIPAFYGRDMVEPVLALRKLSSSPLQYDLGVFYTYNELLIGGLSYKRGGILNLTAGLKLNDRVMLGYTREALSGQLSSSRLGTINEITLRYDFKEQSYQDEFKSYSLSQKASLSINRKTRSSNAGIIRNIKGNQYQQFRSKTAKRRKKVLKRGKPIKPQKLQKMNASRRDAHDYKLNRLKINKQKRKKPKKRNRRRKTY